jgi:hypothetical protein
MNSAKSGLVWLISVSLLLLAVPFAAAEMDNVFLVIDVKDPAPATPGKTFNIEFTIRNYDLDELETVTAYLDPCPAGWECEEKVFAYETKGDHPGNISVRVPEYALAKRYTAYVKLRSEWDTVRGDDRVIIDVAGGGAPEVATYGGIVKTPKEPVAEKVIEPPAPVAEPAVEPVLNETNVTGEGMLEVVDEMLPLINASEVKQNVDRLRTSKQFVEYATVALVIILVFMLVGAYVALRRGDKKK